MNRHVMFYHSPRSRSEGVHALLEELGADYELHLLNLQQGEQRQPEYLAVNLMGKVPAIRHGDAIVTEQPAVYLYLADLYPEAGLAPALDDPLRGPYLRWMVFYGSCFEPALIDRALQREAGKPSMSPYSDFETMFNTLLKQLTPGPYFLGERFTAVDVLWGTALKWVTAFKLVPDAPQIMAYVDRINARPAMQRAAAKDDELAAAQAQA
jgi:glutathione S-transferase